MAWFDRNLEPNRMLLFIITQSYSDSCFAGEGPKSYRYDIKDSEVKENFVKILEKFLAEIDSRDLVTFESPNRNFDANPFNAIYGGTSHVSERFILSCYEEDREKLFTDDPVRFICYTEIEMDDKEKFIEFIKFLMEIY